MGEPHELLATADRRIRLPGGTSAFYRWRVRAAVGNTAADVNFDFGPGIPQRSVAVRGILGSATVNFDADTCTMDRRTALSIELDRYKRSRSLASQIGSQARQTLSNYVLSTFNLRRRGDPYQITFLDSIGGFYSSLRTNTPLDSRICGGRGRNVVKLCTKIIRATEVELATRPTQRHRPALIVRPTVLVLGATGFIGRELVRQLLAANYSVRAVARGSSAALEQFDGSRLEILRRDLRSQSDLSETMKGIEFVYHLAVAPTAKTWDDQRRNNIEVTRLVGEACLAAGVRRLVFTGTINSYYAGARAGTITEQTALDPRIRYRNYYARAKAAEEDLLMEMWRTKHLPVGYFSARHRDRTRWSSVSLRHREMGCGRRVCGMGGRAQQIAACSGRRCCCGVGAWNSGFRDRRPFL